ncbi:MAG: dienelactone hydrolase family protein [Spirochaetota bacterium]
MNRYSRIVSGVVLVLLALGMAGLVFAQDPLDPGERNVNYPGPGGVNLRGYLARPAGRGPFPGVLMIHEWWGLNRDTTILADALADEGFVVLAADAFRGRVARTPSEARAQVTETPGERIAADLDAALDFLRSHSLVDADRVASLGFCFGGTQSMYLGTRNPELAAVVIFYGGGPIQDPGRLGSMHQAGPVLGIYGKEDGNIPVDQVRRFEDAMDARGVENTITVYPGVGHAFVKSDTFRSGGAPGRAWKQMVDFLEDTLKN